MAVQIIIDGYNLIRQSATLSLIDDQDMQEGREALINLLAEYRQFKPHAITVVFDGTDAPGHLQRNDRILGIDIKFSPPGQTADRVIKKLAAEKKEKAVVVSSDLEVVRFAESEGAAIISSPDFEAKMTQAVLMAGEGDEATAAESGWSPGVKKKGPARKLSKKERRRRRKTKKL